MSRPCAQSWCRNSNMGNVMNKYLKFAGYGVAGFILGNMMVQQVLLREAYRRSLHAFEVHSKLIAVLAGDMTDEGHVRMQKVLTDMGFEHLTENLDASTT